MVFGSLFNFLKRHRKKLFYAGAFAAGSYAFARYIFRKWKQAEDEKISDVLAKVRKEYHFDSNEKTYCAAVAGRISTLRAHISRELDCESLAALVKTKPENRIQLWKQLQCMAVTRAVAAVYSTCLLTTALRVQLSLLSGYMFADNLSREVRTRNWISSSSSEAPLRGSGLVPSPAVQQKYLETLHHLLSDGLCSLLQIVTNAVHGHISRWSIDQPLTYADIRKLIDGVRADVEGDSSQLGHRAHRLIVFLFPEEDSDKGGLSLSKDEVALRRIMGETRDIVESADYHMILGQSLDRGFYMVLDRIGDHYNKTHAKASAAEQSKFADCYSFPIPLPLLVSPIAKLALSLLADSPNSFVQDLVQLECAKRFGHNVYEAFCESVSGLN